MRTYISSLITVACLFLSPNGTAYEKQIPSDARWISYPGGEGIGKGKNVIFIAADQEYRSEQAMPMLAQIFSKTHGFNSTVLFGVNEKGEVDPTLPVHPKKGNKEGFKKHNIPGLEHLNKADIVIFFTRLLSLPDDQLEHIVNYIDSGKPILALRTANHGFRGAIPYSINGKKVHFGRDVLGGAFMNHHGGWKREATRGIIEPKNKMHPILVGVTDIFGPSDVYRTYQEGGSLPDGCTTLVWGQPLVGLKKDDAPNSKKEPLPVAWCKDWTTSKGEKARVFHTTMGSARDLESPGLRRLVLNAALWSIGLQDQISPKLSVEYQSRYNPRNSGFNYQKLGVTAQPVAAFK